MDLENLPHWETLAAFHGTGRDRIYDLEAIIAGADTLDDHERRALELATRGRGVAGLDVMHLQCHLGGDAVSLARRGARVTGVDFSPTALARLAGLAAACEVSVATVEADSRRLPALLEDSFDLVYATVGVIGWIDDLDAWMDSVARVLRPGGHLVLVEIHPMLQMVETPEPLVVDFPYNFDGPHHFSGHGSYANREADVTWTTVEYAHGLAEVVMAAHRAGLALAHLEEHLDMASDPRGLGLEADGRFRLRLGRGLDGQPPEPVPVLYTLIARRAGVPGAPAPASPPDTPPV